MGLGSIADGDEAEGSSVEGNKMKEAGALMLRSDLEWGSDLLGLEH